MGALPPTATGLKKKSPKTTTAKKALDAWQKRYFVLSGGELRYYKSEKTANMSNGESIKSISLEQVLCATVNPRQPEAFVIDLGHDRKVKLQAASEAERDEWVAAIEAAKSRHEHVRQQAPEVKDRETVRKRGEACGRITDHVNDMNHG